MNERILELAEQAESHAQTEYAKWTPTPDFSGVPHVRSLFNKKFAELIIDEAFTHILDYEFENQEFITRKQLKQHFGVEE